MTAKKEVNAIAKRQLAQREALWPGCQPYLWDRNLHKGFTTIPKTMPLILRAMDEMTNGKPVSATYLDLWCSTWDNSLVNITMPRRRALTAGFTGERAEYTWGQRMKLLHELAFINAKPGDVGSYSHVIILNPHNVIRCHHEKKTPGLTEATYTMLINQALDIGAKDMMDPPPVPVPVPVPVAAPA